MSWKSFNLSKETKLSLVFPCHKCFMKEIQDSECTKSVNAYELSSVDCLLQALPSSFHNPDLRHYLSDAELQHGARHPRSELLLCLCTEHSALNNGIVVLIQRAVLCRLWRWSEFEIRLALARAVLWACGLLSETRTPLNGHRPYAGWTSMIYRVRDDWVTIENIRR